MHGSLSFIQQFIHSNIHKMFQALCCQLLLISLNALFIHKFIPNQFLDCHDTYHNFVFSVSLISVNYSCVSYPTHQRYCHMPLFLFITTSCFPKHQHRAWDKVCSQRVSATLNDIHLSWRQG